ncbi:hypothetical protein V6Z12_A05G155100 [Gossypium hirsutum]
MKHTGRISRILTEKRADPGTPYWILVNSTPWNLLLGRGYRSYH